MAQKRVWAIVTVLAVLALGTWMIATPIVSGQATQTGDKWLHVSVVSNEANGETVRVNVPLSLAEKVLPAINKDKLRAGKIKVDECHLDGVDLRAIFDAVKSTKDGEFVTVESPNENVRVAKLEGYMVVKVRDSGKHRKAAEKSTEKAAEKPVEERVEVKIPITVMDALFSGAKDELDLLAAIRALSAHGDAVLVSVEDHQNKVRVWVDSKNTGM